WQVTEGNLVGDDSLAGDVTRESGNNVGNYAISAADLENGNYVISAVDGTLTINPRPLTVTADDQEKIYGDADPELTWQVTEGNLVGDDSLAGDVTRESGNNVGNYAISAADLENGNYVISAVDGTLTINPRPLTVTADDQEKIYGDADPELTWQVTEGNLVGDDSLAGDVTRESGNNVGNYAISAADLENGNYQITATDGVLTIDPRPLTVTADDQEKVYGDADPELTWQVTEGNLVGDDSLAGDVTRESGNNVGNYAISAADLENGNYVISAVDGTLTIDPRPITVSADDQDKIYGDADPELTWQVTEGNLVGDDRLAGDVTRESGNNVGNYAISAADLENGNYVISAVDGTLTIDPRPITVSADDQ
ncbi:MBG-2 domain-containing protein, partial [Halomonas zhaodongensis]